MAIAMASLRATTRGKTRSREEQAKTNVVLAKSNGYERGNCFEQMGIIYQPFTLMG